MDTQKVDQAALDMWSSRPICCPFCTGPVSAPLTEWSAVSVEDNGNVCTLEEYQCEGACQGRSFFA